MFIEGDNPLFRLSAWHLQLTVLLTQLSQGSFLTMLSEGDVYVLNYMESVELDCEFQAKRYNLFDYPVLWKKAQLREMTQINIMGNINEPYVSSDRFEVNYKPEAPRHRLTLTISDLSSVDSGNYTCEIRGPQSILLGSVTHYVYVRTAIKRMAVTSDNGTTASVPNADYNTHYRPGTLTLTERDPASVKCQVTGGYPPPQVQIYLDDEDISREFQFTHEARLSGKMGLRDIVYDTQRWTHMFVARAEDDGKHMKCIATSAGLKSNISLVTLSVHYKPRIQCYRAGSYLGDEKVHIKCEIKGKPPVQSIKWLIDDEGTILQDGEVVNGYWTRRETREDGLIESTLFLTKAELGSFKKYRLVAENAVAPSSEDVELFRKYKSSSTQPLSRGKDGRQTRDGGYVYSNSAKLHAKSKVLCVYSLILFSVNSLFTWHANQINV